MLEYTSIENLKPNPTNPRVIKDDKFNQLVNSIKNFPQMLNLRPIVVDENMVVLGGNMRLKALTEAGITNVPYIKAGNLTEEQKREFIIKDNVGYGEWDWDVLQAEWDLPTLEEWGMDIIQHDWEDLEYIEDDPEDVVVNDDTKLTVVIPDGHDVGLITNDIRDLLKDYPGCEVK